MYPNFSEGKNKVVLESDLPGNCRDRRCEFTQCRSGATTNHYQMVTFTEHPMRLLKLPLGHQKAAELTLTKHKGEHPRMRLQILCHWFPISGNTMEETAKYAKKVEAARQRIKYMYLCGSGKNRKGKTWLPSGPVNAEDSFRSRWMEADFGPAVMNTEWCHGVEPRFLVAYNVSLNTVSERKANSVAFDVRETGRVMKKGRNHLEGWKWRSPSWTQ